MQIFGSVKNKDARFQFHLNSKEPECFNEQKTYLIAGKKIFIHIDGEISKLSNRIRAISKHYKSLHEKIAYLYSIDFNFECHICGSFNIFLYDYSRKKLKIIRDTRGTRSLYYANTPNDFIFSSNQESIVSKLKKVSLNKAKLIDFLNWDYRSNDETYFNEIHRAIPSFYVSFVNETLTCTKYTLSDEIFSDVTKKDKKNSFKESLYHSVEGIIKRDKRIGVMMSGGLDSSAIAIALKERNYENVRTYSANFNHVTKDKEIDETTYQKNVSELTSYPHSFIKMEGKSPIKPIQDFTKALNQPILFPNIYIFKEIVRKLKSDNIEIILDGNDGDNTISHGFEVLYAYFINFRFVKYLNEVYLYSKFVNGSFIKLLNTFTKQAIKKAFKIRNTGSRSSILKKNLKISKNPKNIISFFSSHRDKLSIDLHFQANENRNDFFRHFGIENYSPFYDEELINFCINMPNKLKFDNGYTRKVLRDFLSDFLPIDHAFRDKSILTPGLIENFTVADLNIIKDELNNINSNLLHLVDLDMLQKIIDKIDLGNKITEDELISFQVFVSANTFLNYYGL